VYYYELVPASSAGGIELDLQVEHLSQSKLAKATINAKSLIRPQRCYYSQPFRITVL
jgi:hypothetical protein